MSVDYNNFAKTFSNSRKNMKWEEIEYFLSFLYLKKDLRILDIGCGNARFLRELNKNYIDVKSYLGIDLSSGLLKEAKKTYPKNNFLELNMLNIANLKTKFTDIFFIASFHHLKTIDERLDVLKKTYNILEDNGKVFMTNWALNSELNFKKYEKSIISGTKNKFGGVDYNIKIGKYERFYHCFSLKELDFLFVKSGFKIIKNYLFENNKNFVIIINKN